MKFSEVKRPRCWDTNVMVSLRLWKTAEKKALKPHLKMKEKSCGKQLIYDWYTMRRFHFMKLL